MKIIETTTPKETFSLGYSIAQKATPGQKMCIRDRSIRLLGSGGYLGAPQYGEMRMDDSIDVPRNLWGKDSRNFSAISSPAFFLFSHAVDLLHYYFTPRKVVRVYAKGKKSVIGRCV